MARYVSLKFHTFPSCVHNLLILLRVFGQVYVIMMYLSSKDSEVFCSKFNKWTCTYFLGIHSKLILQHKTANSSFLLYAGLRKVCKTNTSHITGCTHSSNSYRVRALLSLLSIKHCNVMRSLSILMYATHRRKNCGKIINQSKFCLSSG